MADASEARPAPGGTAWGAFALCSTVWGSTFLVIRIGNETLPALWAATLRLVLAETLLLAILALRRERFPSGAALRHALGFGFLNFGLSFALLYVGERSVSSGLTAVVYATIPLSTALFARAFGLERLSAPKVAGALVALGGVAWISAGQLGGAVSPLAIGLVLTAATCASLSGIVLKLGPRQSPIGANAAGALVGIVVCGLASVVTGESHALPGTSGGWLSVLYLTVFGSLVAFVTYAWLVTRWPVTRTSFISVIVPVVALVLGALFLHERLTVAEFAGSALVLAGLGIALLSELRRARH